MVIKDPHRVSREITVQEAREISDRYNTSLMVVDQKQRLIGIVTHRDLIFEKPDTKILAIMTKGKDLITAPPNTAIKRAQRILHRNRIEKLPLVNKDGTLAGLITVKDILKRTEFPDATKDSEGRLRVGAAIGVRDDYFERAEMLIDAEVDVIVVDIAHGHSDMAIAAVKGLKKRFPEVEVITGNIATPSGVKDLQKAGADAVKVGVGPGSVCTTRVVAGTGFPQLSAILKCARAAKVPLIADGGIRYPGDVTKALAAGAQTVMIGNLFAGISESPGAVVTRNGKRFKLYRGMAGYGASLSRKGPRGRGEEDQLLIDSMTPEGVDALVPYRGSAAEAIRNIVGGVRSGMSYSGAQTIAQLQEKAKFVRVTLAGIRESHSHDVAEL